MSSTTAILSVIGYAVVFQFDTPARCGRGPKVAAILSVVESCRLGVPVKEYLLAVLPGMNQRKVSELALLTPA